MSSTHPIREAPVSAEMAIDETAAARAGTARQDGLFLVSAAVLSFILYIGGLGFYSDDWVFLSLLHLAPDQTLPGLAQALFEGDAVIRQRPVQLVMLAVLYRLFGLEPLGYHAFNAAAITANALLFFLVMRELRQPRLLAVAAPLVYLLLPHYATDRFWVAAFQATLSITFYLLSLYALLRGAREEHARQLRWSLLSAAGLLASGLAYEVALPLFLLHPLWILVSAAQRHGWTAGANRRAVWREFRQRTLALLAAPLLALLLVIVYKAIFTARLNVSADLGAHLTATALGAARVNFGTYGAGLPYVVAWILRHDPPWLLLITAGLAGLYLFWYLRGTAPLPGDWDLERKAWLRMALLGLVLFALGYAVFAVNADVWFTSTSLGNRVAIAAAIGVTFTLLGAAGWLVSWVTAPAARRALLCLAVTLLCVSGFLINNTLARFWTEAYRQQQAVLTVIRQEIPDLPPGSVLVLDGICLEHGGAYLFTGQRDLGALLRMIYNDPSLEATAITNRPRIEESGLSVLTFRAYDFFPYGSHLFAFHAERKTLTPLTEAAAARRYFQASGFAPETDCPPGFAWGWNAP